MSDAKATIIGCGLIGGSICLALKRRRPGLIVAALDLPERVPAVSDAGVADQVAPVGEAAAHVKESSLVILAAPVKAIIDLLEIIAPHLRPGTVVTDVGSTKTLIMEKARRLLPTGVHFIGGHPIAGGERSGVAEADPLLFNGRIYALCPYQDTPGDALVMLVDMVEDLLALPVTIEPEEHDRIMAMISHVPQLLAIALMHAALEDDATHGLLDMVAGQGFLDLTRIAASEFEVWKGILETNKPAINSALDRLEKNLSMLRRALDAGAAGAVWERASKRRRRMSMDDLPRMRTPDLRRLVDRYDEQILKALSNRMRAVRRIGKLKADQEAPVHDPDRERRVLRQRQEWGRSLDLPPDLVEDLFAVVMKHSKTLQARILKPLTD